jgi:hypothetical protein
VDFDEGPFEGEVCALPNMKVFRLHATNYLSETNTTPSFSFDALPYRARDQLKQRHVPCICSRYFRP